MDGRQREIVETLERHGATVLPLRQVGDVLLVGYDGVNYLLIVTTGPRAAPGEVEAPFLNQWAGAVETAWDGASALAVVRGARRPQPAIGQTEHGLPTI